MEKNHTSKILVNIDKELGKKRKGSDIDKEPKKKKKINDYFSKEAKKNEEDNGLSNYKYTKIPREFYLVDVVILAKELLGKIIVRKIDGVTVKARIVETEAYKGPEDKGAHSYNNRKTERTKYFWQEGGHLYVYMIHNSNCVNIVAGEDHKPEAVLIRAVEPLEGIEKIKELRGEEGKMTASKLANLSNGPGKVCSALKIDRGFNGLDLCSSDDMFLVEDSNYKVEVERSVRINIDYAQEYIYKPWRFFIKNNTYVSKVKLKYEYKDE